MIKLNIRYVIFTLIFFVFASDPADSGERVLYDQTGSYPLESLEFSYLIDETRDHRLVPLKVHYPAMGQNYPLVIISHGGGGNWDANLYQARHLASRGYVAICVEHVKSNDRFIRLLMSSEGGGLEFIEALHRITTDPGAVLGRPLDVRFAIDQAERWNRNHKDLAGKIETGKVAVMGHSFGAYTTLVVCGGRPVLDYLEPQVDREKGLSGDLSDSRVAFGLAMSPQSPGSTFFNRESYQSIDRPIICLSGSRDVQKSASGKLMLPRNRLEVFRLLPPGDKYFFWLDQADHLSFSDGPKAWFLPSKARLDAQRISKALMVASCDYFLKGKKEALPYLSESYANTLCGEVVSKVQVNSK